MNDYFTIVAGKFLSPFGTYNERYHPSWINAMPNAPLGFGHGGSFPTYELGLQFRGGFYLGSSKLNYALYASNGPILNTGENNREQAGTLVYTNFRDNNPNKAIGGRISWLPFKNSSLELGVSGQTAKVGNLGSDYQNIGALLYTFDISYVKTLDPLMGRFQLLGQYNTVEVDRATYVNTHEAIEDGKDSLYSFLNK